MNTFIFGHTALGRPIPALKVGGQGPEVLILGGVHGDESEGSTLAWALWEWALKNFSMKLQLTIVPMLNFDGVLTQSRLNANGVDLNRNLPTKDWTAKTLNPRYPPGPFAGSEPENAALLNWLKSNQARMIFSLHSWQPLLNVNGDCEPEAEVLRKWLNYKITKEIGYSTPGCLGTYCGLERNVPTLTYEIERGLAVERIIKEHMPALREALKVSEERLNSDGI